MSQTELWPQLIASASALNHLDEPPCATKLKSMRSGDCNVRLWLRPVCTRASTLVSMVFTTQRNHNRWLPKNRCHTNWFVGCYADEIHHSLASSMP